VYASRRVGWVDTHDDELGLGVGGKVALDDGEFVAFGGAESGASGVEEGEHHDPPPKRRQRGLVSTLVEEREVGSRTLVARPDDLAVENRRARGLRMHQPVGGEPAGGRQDDRRDRPHGDQATRGHDPNFRTVTRGGRRRGDEVASGPRRLGSVSAWSRFTVMTAARTAFASNAMAAPAICWSVRVPIPPSLEVWR
jgi:hypothetical protein